MSEPASMLPAPAPRRRLWLLLPLLVLLAGLGWGAWYLWQRVETATDTLEAEDALIRRMSYQLRELEAQTEHLARRNDDADGINRRTVEQLLALQSQHEESGKALQRIDETLRGGRARFQLAAVEELLLIAADRAQLARDAAGAAQALDLADQRLARLADPRLNGVREALAAERLALRAVPPPDFAGASLSLGGLATRAPQWPLAARVPEHFEPVSGGPREELPPGAEWPTRVFAMFKQALASVFRVQRQPRTVDRLLPPEQEALVRHLMLIKLEGARLALLRADAAAYRDLLDSAHAWLDDYYKGGDPGVLAAQAELERLRAIALAPTIPEPVQALARLRSLLGAGG